MPSLLPQGVQQHLNGAVDVEEERAVMRHGTIEQRRRLLRMRRVPTPDDIEAVAVPGTAILDLPNFTPSTTTTARLSHTMTFDPLQHIAARYGVGRDEQADEEANDVDDCTDFIEVLCPDGSSLLEMLPLTSSSDCSNLENQNAQTSNSPPRRSDETCEPQNTELSDSPDQLLSTDTPQAVHVDAPILFPAPQNPSDYTNPETPTSQPQQSSLQCPDIFVSVGCCLVPSPRSSRCRSKHSSSSERYSSESCQNGRTPSSDSSSPTGRTTTAPRSPFAVYETCDVAGRILLTDRLVQSQAYTALPTVMKAYQQYLEASAAASAASASAFSESSHKHIQRHSRSPNRLSSKEKFMMAQRQLAPRQRGIVLQCSNTDPEVMKCVAKAVSCQRPSFRQIDQADLYGSSCYIFNNSSQQY